MMIVWFSFQSEACNLKLTRLSLFILFLTYLFLHKVCWYMYMYNPSFRVTCCAKIMATKSSFSSGMLQLSGTFSFLGNGVVKCFVITTSVSQVTTAKIN